MTLPSFSKSPGQTTYFAEGRGRTVDEWKMRPEARDNHWWDCTVGCAVAASMCGCVLPGTDNLRPKKDAKPRLNLSEIRKGRR